MRGGSVVEAIAQPYAEALMSLAQGQNLVERFGSDVQGLLDLLTQSEDLREFLANPLTKGEDKKAVLRSLLTEQVHPYTLSFLLLLVDRRRILFLEQIGKHFQALLRKLNQVALAEVTTAVELNEAQQGTIREKALQMTGARDVELNIAVDPDLIGGVIIRVGSQVVDASIQGQLRRIATRLSSSTV
ncbi:ATP synthase F1 subunit delta [Leptolyngbya sp. FACHB-261]|uniref:ATP synthase F1 subunit delta n=1 Tax=Leptolyngbya sp. FACHB-261 TaxID=2692806 RepID=UPI0016840661|nr:ATP synthase F1 subunit delta [Leptolyngbya sp. FACHB-261]MBD2100611.1 F0F1 ATP synthase subunit delta [Leptolyngbya sp. FACHB-261]